MSEMKDILLSCARDLYLEQGYNNFSMRKVARRAGVSATAIYRHFANREELLCGVQRRGFQLFMARLEGATGAETALARLHQVAQAYHDFAVEQRGYYEIMFMSTDQMTGLEELNDEGGREMEASFSLLENLVAECIEEGSIQAEDARSAAIALWAQCHGLVSLFFAGQLTDDAGELARAYGTLVPRFIATL